MKKLNLNEMRYINDEIAYVMKQFGVNFNEAATIVDLTIKKMVADKKLAERAPAPPARPDVLKVKVVK